MLGRASLLRYQGMSQVNKGETNRAMTTHDCRSGLGGKVREGKFLATDGGLRARAPRGQRVWYGLASLNWGDTLRTSPPPRRREICRGLFCADCPPPPEMPGCRRAKGHLALVAMIYGSLVVRGVERCADMLIRRASCVSGAEARACMRTHNTLVVQQRHVRARRVHEPLRGRCRALGRVRTVAAIGEP